MRRSRIVTLSGCLGLNMLSTFSAKIRSVRYGEGLVSFSVGDRLDVDAGDVSFH